MRRSLLGIAVLLLVAGTASAGTVTINGNSYTYTDHPRVFLDGSAGTITARVKDPDGAGAGVAPQATDANPAFVALKAKIRFCVSYNCVGEYGYTGSGELGTIVALAALDWYMDNSQTDSLATAKYWLNNIEKTHYYTTVPHTELEFGCDWQVGCGIQSLNDWPSTEETVYALAYTLIRGQMSAGEKTTFAQKVLNDNTRDNGDAGCTPQLEQTNAVVNYTNGTTSITGSGFSGKGLANGSVIYIKKASFSDVGAWGTVSSVTGDTLITLTSAMTYASEAPYTSNITSGQLWRRNAWTSTTCGLTWILKNMTYNGQRVGRRATTQPTNLIDYSQTNIPVVSTAAFPSSFPYYISFNSEFMKVTGKDAGSFTVERAQLGSAAVSKYPQDFFYERYLPNIYVNDPTNNLTITKVLGHVAMGIALLDDDPTQAGALLNDAASEFILDIAPKNKEAWTGFQQGGSTGYGLGRQATYNMQTAFMLSQLTGAPSLDTTGGNWFKNFVYYLLYDSMPNDPASNVPWGQPNIAGTSNYGNQGWGMFFPQVYAASDEAKYFNYWQRENDLYTGANLQSSTWRRLIPYSMLYQQESDPSADYSGLPTQKAFNVPDTASQAAISAFISRTGWASADDTLLFQAGWSLVYSVDHIGPGAPGAYKLFKRGWLLTENGYNEHTGSGADTNMILWAGSANMKSGSNAVHVVAMDKSDSGTGWAFSRVNSQAAYWEANAVTRALRYIVHFKKAASPDYVVVYDDDATSQAQTISQNLHYERATGESSSVTDTLPDFVWTGPDRRVSTKVILPSGTGVARTATSLTYAFRKNICASTDGSTCAAVTSAEFLLVHRPSTSTGDTMPTVAALGTIDANFRGVQIEGTAPSVAVFPKAGVYRTSATLTSTHSGSAQYVVTGLESGIYDVVRDGTTTVVDDETLDASGTIAFESVAGAFVISRSGEVPAITITTTTLANGVQSQAYSAQLEYSGGTPPVTFSVTAGSLCGGLSLSAAGAISGTPTTVQTCNFTAKVVDNAAAEDTQALALTIVTPPPSLTVTATPGSTSVLIQFGTPTLDQNQSCSAVVADIVGPVTTVTSPSGASTRTVSATGLTVSTNYTVTVTCGTVASGSTSFTTNAAPVGGTVSWKYTVKPHARLVARGVAKVSVGYQLMNQTPEQTPDYIDASCATGCTVTLPLLSGQVYAIHHVWRTAGDATVAVSRAGLVAVP